MGRFSFLKNYIIRSLYRDTIHLLEHFKIDLKGGRKEKHFVVK